MNDIFEIGRRIKIRREEIGLTQEELGNLLGLNKSTIQRYESGKIESIKIPVLQAMAKQLNVNPDWLALKTESIGSYISSNNTGLDNKLDGIYFRLGKEAQELGLDEEDINAILNVYRKHKKNNE